MSCSVIIRVSELPSPDCFDTKATENAAIIHASQECDSTLDLIINDKNVLSGYHGVYVYPVFAFLRSLALGARLLLHESQATIPIFLQQYSFSSSSPCHTLRVVVNHQNPELARMTFNYYPAAPKPLHLPNVDDEPIRIEDFLFAIVHNVNLFERETRRILLELFPSIGTLLAELFSTVPDIEQEWEDYIKRTKFSGPRI